MPLAKLAGVFRERSRRGLQGLENDLRQPRTLVGLEDVLGVRAAIE